MLRTALLASALSAASSARVAPEVAAARAEAAVLASFVVDAAAMSFHWVYSQQTIKDAVGSGDPEFFVPPENYFYHGVVGQNTPYGQQNIAYLKVGAASGGFDPAAVETAYFSIYNPSTVRRADFAPISHASRASHSPPPSPLRSARARMAACTSTSRPRSL